MLKKILGKAFRDHYSFDDIEGYEGQYSFMPWSFVDYPMQPLTM
jgi:hypothetical protein